MEGSQLRRGESQSHHFALLATAGILCILAYPQSWIPPVLYLSIAILLALRPTGGPLGIFPFVATGIVCVLWYAAHPLTYSMYFGGGDLFFHLQFIELIEATDSLPDDPSYGYHKFPLFHILGATLALGSGLSVLVSIHVLGPVAILLAAYALATILKIGIESSNRQLFRVDRLHFILFITILCNRQLIFHAFTALPRTFAFGIFALTALLLTWGTLRGRMIWTCLALFLGLALAFSHSVMPLQAIVVLGPVLIVAIGTRAGPTLIVFLTSTVATILFRARDQLVGSFQFFTAVSQGALADLEQPTRAEIDAFDRLGNLDNYVLILLLGLTLISVFSLRSRSLTRLSVVTLVAGALYLPTPLTSAAGAVGLQIWRWQLLLGPLVCLAAVFGTSYIVRGSQSPKRIWTASALLVILVAGAFYNPLVYSAGEWENLPRNYLTASEMSAVSFAGAVLNEVTTDADLSRALEVELAADGGFAGECMGNAFLLVRTEAFERGVLSFINTPPVHIRLDPDSEQILQEQTDLTYNNSKAWIGKCRLDPDKQAGR